MVANLLTAVIIIGIILLSVIRILVLGRRQLKKDREAAKARGFTEVPKKYTEQIYGGSWYVGPGNYIKKMQDYSLATFATRASTRYSSDNAGGYTHGFMLITNNDFPATDFRRQKVIMHGDKAREIKELFPKLSEHYLTTEDPQKLKEILNDNAIEFLNSLSDAVVSVGFKGKRISIILNPRYARTLTRSFDYIDIADGIIAAIEGSDLQKAKDVPIAMKQSDRKPSKTQVFITEYLLGMFFNFLKFSFIIYPAVFEFMMVLLIFILFNHGNLPPFIASIFGGKDYSGNGFDLVKPFLVWGNIAIIFLSAILKSFNIRINATRKLILSIAGVLSIPFIVVLVGIVITPEATSSVKIVMMVALAVVWLIGVGTVSLVYLIDRIEKYAFNSLKNEQNEKV